ncbi:AMP-binding protein [Oscillatoria amoena NRMC-F 0135]|nr:AMP-binding protein [Oscillatoria amoena NRMC-F 0135]
MNYQFEHIRINQRDVAIADILSGKETGQSPFEGSVFDFISRWLRRVESFNQHTSGSTGLPKEIKISRSQMVASATRTLRMLPISQGDCALVCLHPDYIAGKMMLVRALEFNLKIEAVEPSSDPLHTLSGDFTNGFAAFVPLQLHSMLDQTERIFLLNKMNVILVGGAPVTEALHQKIRLLHCPVYATYGMTETISNIALQKLNGNDAAPFFRVLPGISIKIDIRNCLVITLPENAEPVVTNDVAELVSDTTFRILGRLDNVINTGGLKILPEQLEVRAEKIMQEAGITRSFIFGGISDEKFGETLALIIEGSALQPEAEIMLLMKFKNHWANHEAPRRICYVSRFSRTDSGKINRSEILKNIR